MSKQEFIVTLRSELKKLPPEEVVAATEYYEEYFSEMLESGEKTEEEIVAELGNPKRLAAQIRADYAARILGGDETVLEGKPTVRKKISAVWWVIIGVVTAPVSIPLALFLSVIAIVAVVVILGIILAIVGGIIGAGVMAIMAIVIAIASIGSAVSTVLSALGTGLVLAAIVAAACVGLFLAIRGLIRLIGRRIHKNNEKKMYRKYGVNQLENNDAQWTYVSEEDKEDEKEFYAEIQAEEAEAETPVEPETSAAPSTPQIFRMADTMTMPACNATGGEVNE